jgi:hypothetical protein
VGYFLYMRARFLIWEDMMFVDNALRKMFINWKVSEVISLQWTLHRRYSTLYTYESIEILDLNPHVLWRRC